MKIIKTANYKKAEFKQAMGSEVAVNIMVEMSYHHIENDDLYSKLPEMAINKVIMLPTYWDENNLMKYDAKGNPPYLDISKVKGAIDITKIAKKDASTLYNECLKQMKKYPSEFTPGRDYYQFFLDEYYIMLIDIPENGREPVTFDLLPEVDATLYSNVDFDEILRDYYSDPEVRRGY